MFRLHESNTMFECWVTEVFITPTHVTCAVHN